MFQNIPTESLKYLQCTDKIYGNILLEILLKIFVLVGYKKTQKNNERYILKLIIVVIVIHFSRRI